MEKNNTAQYEKMTKTPVEKLIPILAVPTIISMLVSAIYNLADTFFVSQINTSASGAVGVVFSLMAVMQALGFLFGMGAGSNISRLLGNQDLKQASQIAVSAVVATFLIGCGITVVGLLFLQPIMSVLGATETILPYAESYARYIFFGAPFICTSFVMNNILRAQGKAFFSMIGLGFGSVLNIILDPILIYVCNLGISGAAIATLFSQLVSFCILLYFFVKGKSLIPLDLKCIGKTVWVYLLIVKTGMPSFARQCLASIANIFLNNAAKDYGDPAVAAMSIVGRICFMLIAVLLGFGQGFQPVVGYAYGAGNYKRVRQSFRFSLAVGTVALSILSIVCLAFAPQVITIFRKDDAAVIEIGTYALRLQCLTLFLQPLVVLCNMLLQSVGKSFEATIVSSARQGLFFIPLILLLPRCIGLLGIQIAQPIGDALAALVSFYYAQKFFRQLPCSEEIQKTEEQREF